MAINTLWALQSPTLLNKLATSPRWKTPKWAIQTSNLTGETFQERKQSPA